MADKSELRRAQAAEASLQQQLREAQRQAENTAARQAELRVGGEEGVSRGAAMSVMMMLLKKKQQKEKAAKAAQAANGKATVEVQ